LVMLSVVTGLVTELRWRASAERTHNEFRELAAGLYG